MLPCDFSEILQLNVFRLFQYGLKFVLPLPLKIFCSLRLCLTLYFSFRWRKPISPLKDLHFQSFFKGIRVSAEKWWNVCRFSPQFNKPSDRMELVLVIPMLIQAQMILNDQCLQRNKNHLLVWWPLEIYRGKKEGCSLNCFLFFPLHFFVIIYFQIVPKANVPFWHVTPPSPINEPSQP